MDRAAIRHKTFERTTITVDGATSVAHILNLSATGALLHSNAPVDRSARGFVDIGGRQVAGVVMWIAGSRFGLRFDRPPTADVIDLLMR